MTVAEEMTRGINGLFAQMGEPALTNPAPGTWQTELALLRLTKQEYRTRLVSKQPRYGLLPSEALIPDAFWQALLNRQRELEREKGK